MANPARSTTPAYASAAVTRPPNSTRVLPNRLTSLGVSVGASTVSSATTSIARPVCSVVQSRISCR